MSEAVGGLIEMNAHMVRAAGFDAMMGIGVTGIVVFVCLLIFAIGEKSRSGIWGCSLLVLAFAVVIIVALQLPMKKQIHACANGAISLESIAAVYDIVDVDGKELVLRER